MMRTISRQNISHVHTDLCKPTHIGRHFGLENQSSSVEFLVVDQWLVLRVHIIGHLTCQV